MLKNLLYLFDGTCISSGTGQAVAVQSCTITDCVNSGEELTLGSTCCSCLEVKIFAPDGELNIPVGKEVRLCKVQDGGEPVQAGVFLPEHPAKVNAGIYKLTAYDKVSLFDKDLSSWLKSLTGWPYSLLTFAGMVCKACGLTLATTEIPNGSFPVQQFFKSGVTGRQLMQWIGEIAGRFCRANADGDITFDWYTSSGVTIRPTGERYYFGGALTYDDYEVAPIDAVKLRLADSENGVLWPPPVTMGTVTYEYLRIRSGPGTSYAEVGRLQQGDRVKILEKKTVNGTDWGRIDRGWICLTGYVTLETVAADNPYVITGNAILLAKVTEDLIPYLNTLQTRLAGLPAYKPCKVSLPADMDIRAGQTVQIEDKHGNTFTTLVMTKTQKGQRDTLECTGSVRRDSSSAVNNQPASEAARQAVENQTHEDIMNRLTKNGKIQGIYVQDDKWYINAEDAILQNLKVTMAQITDLKINAADITGVLKVLNGTDVLLSAGEGAVSIAGWDVSKDTIKYGTLGESGSMWLCRTGTTDAAKIADKDQSGWCIAVGQNFGVDQHGKLFANGATLTGSITADTGFIGSWSFSRDGGLYCDNTWSGEVSLHNNCIKVSWSEFDASGAGAVEKTKYISWKDLAKAHGTDTKP